MSGAGSLEERYRRLLRVLPEPARSRWADEMTDTYLTATCTDDPEFAEFGSPDLTDRLDVWGLALRLRLGGPGASARAAVTGATVRWVALLGSLGVAAPAAIAQLARTLFPDLPWVGWQAPLLTLSTVLWVALFGCLVHGSAVARPVAVGLLALQLFGVITAVSTPPWLGLVLIGPVIPALAALVVEPTREARPGRWWGGAAVATVLVGGLPFLSLVSPIWVTSDAARAVVLTGLGLVAVRSAAVPVAGAVAVLAALELPPLVVSALTGGPGGYAATQAGSAALLAGAGLACTVVVVRAVRRLPRAVET